MIDRLLGNIFGWFDKLNEKLNEVLTFDYPKPKPRRKKNEKKESVKIAIVSAIVKTNYTHIIGITIFVFVRYVNVRRSKR